MDPDENLKVMRKCLDVIMKAPKNDSGYSSKEEDAR